MRRLIDWLLGVRCPHCGERTHYLLAHLHIEHAGDYE